MSDWEHFSWKLSVLNMCGPAIKKHNGVIEIWEKIHIVINNYAGARCLFCPFQRLRLMIADAPPPSEVNQTSFKDIQNLQYPCGSVCQDHTETKASLMHVLTLFLSTFNIN